MAQRKPEVIDPTAIDEARLVLRRIESATGITVAYKHGKTSAREVTFIKAGETVHALLMRKSLDDKCGDAWVVTTAEGHIAGYFGGYDVIGVWETGIAQAITAEAGSD